VLFEAVTAIVVLVRLCQFAENSLELENTLQLKKRNLMTNEALPVQGLTIEIVEMRDSTSGFYKYDLICFDSAKHEVVFGFQAQSFNLDSLIDLMSTDNTDAWRGKLVTARPTIYKDIKTIRFFKTTDDEAKTFKAFASKK
jgi:hypothetical protein